jgi:hypothetical protein
MGTPRNRRSCSAVRGHFLARVLSKLGWSDVIVVNLKHPWLPEVSTPVEGERAAPRFQK